QTVDDQADDFSRLPERGGTPLVFMITWGWLDHDGQWQSGQLVARELSHSAEAEMKADWLAELRQLGDSFGVELRDIRLIHWGNSEVPLPDLDWFDFLDNVIHPEPVTIRGAFGFALAEG